MSDMTLISHGDNVHTIQGFLQKAQCESLITHSEQIGYADAPIQVASGAKIVKEHRNNERIVFDDPLLADTFFSRAQAYLPATVQDWKLVGLNERFRFYRYEPGQYFKWHRDGSFRRNENELSVLSFLIYLNDDFEGGNTDFEFGMVKPETGSALIFAHPLLHQGAAIKSGTKYVLRTDVMYRRVSA